MIARGVVRRFGQLISKAEERTIEKFIDGRLEMEDSISDVFFDKVEEVFNEYGKDNRMTFYARKLKDKVKKSPEWEFGADVCGVLEINSQTFALRKGFLAQAKMPRAGIKIERAYSSGINVTFKHNDEFARLKDQVDKMMKSTPDNFVIIYDPEGFVVVPGSSIQALRSEDEIYGKTISGFFKEYMMCFVGDPGLTAWDDASIRSLREKTNSRTGILLGVSAKEISEEASE